MYTGFMIKQRNSSSTSSVPKLRIWNSRMWIFIYACVPFQRQRGQAKLISLCESLKSWDSAKEKLKGARESRRRNKALPETRGVEFVKDGKRTDYFHRSNVYTTTCLYSYTRDVADLLHPRHPGAWHLTLHQLPGLTVASCKHHLTPKPLLRLHCAHRREISDSN